MASERHRVTQDLPRPDVARQTEADTNAVTFSSQRSRVNLNLSFWDKNAIIFSLWTVTVDEMGPLTGLMLHA